MFSRLYIYIYPGTLENGGQHNVKRMFEAFRPSQMSQNRVVSVPGPVKRISTSRKCLREVNENKKDHAVETNSHISNNSLYTAMWRWTFLQHTISPRSRFCLQFLVRHDVRRALRNGKCVTCDILVSQIFCRCHDKVDFRRPEMIVCVVVDANS